jgi:hypothetical protein
MPPEIPDHIHDAGRRSRPVPGDRIGQSLTGRTPTSVSAIPANNDKNCGYASGDRIAPWILDGQAGNGER